MNTKISYMYRDADNYKSHHVEVLAGVLTDKQVKTLLEQAGDGMEGFIPSQVGLANLQVDLMGYDSDRGEDDYDPFGSDGADHVWHEITGIDSTDKEPTIELTAAQFYKDFSAAMKAGWDVEAGIEAVMGA